jgi:hypothetical protein
LPFVFLYLSLLEIRPLDRELYYSLVLVVRLETSAYHQPYTIELVKAVEDAGVKIYWWEECLHPDDFDGHLKLNQALPHIKFTTGEHEYSK